MVYEEFDDSDACLSVGHVGGEEDGGVLVLVFVRGGTGVGDGFAA